MARGAFVAVREDVRDRAGKLAPRHLWQESLWISSGARVSPTLRSAAFIEAQLDLDAGRERSRSLKLTVW